MLTPTPYAFGRYSVLALAAVLACSAPVRAQEGARRRNAAGGDSIKTVVLPPIIKTAGRESATGPLPDVRGTSIFSGMKSEQINVARVDGNLSLNNTRQMFAHSPGIYIWEFDGTGMQANVAARGLNAHRSSEFNVRMNGADIASDPYGYPEVHFTPPFESLQRIEIVRGAASLQYGSQIGGLLNYVTKAAPTDRAVAVETSQFGGSYGLYSTYTSVAGTIDSLSYYTYLDYRRGDGWRQNGGYWFLTGHANAQWAMSESATLGVDFTAMNFAQHMPNGLTEKQYADNPRASYRPRDWFGAPRIMPAITFDDRLSDNTRLSVLASGLIGERNSITLVTSTAILDTGTNRRRVNRDLFRDVYLEPRLLTTTGVLGMDATIATGFRIARTSTNRSQGLGFDGTDFNLDFNGPKTLDLDFISYNYAAFAEMKLGVTSALSITPGVRVEHLTTRGTGEYYREKPAVTLFAFDTSGPGTAIVRNLDETFPLFGLSAALKISPNVNMYGNVAQSYRPLLYAQQFPYDQIPTDTAIHSARGLSSDLGVRGSIPNIGSFDIGGFFLTYDDRVGVIFPDSTRYPIGFRTNAGGSRHYGIESLVELDLLGILSELSGIERNSSLLLFTSAGYTSAKYVSGPANGKEVENSPDWIVRSGLTLRLGDWLSATVQGSHVGEAFSDAANTAFRADGQQGIIPAYTVFDFSFNVKLASFARLEGTINNLADRRYFTARATAYPGPGILPGDGRGFTAGIRFTL